jgi:two-component system, NtrC family, response regulator AtoC
MRDTAVGPTLAAGPVVRAQSERVIGMMMKPLVLVVDDDEDVRRYLATLLASLEYDAQCLSSGPKALAYLASGPTPAAILLDLVMPGMTGLETLDRFRETHPGIPVIVLSTISEIATVVDAVQRGAADYLAKGCPADALGAALRRVIEATVARKVAPLRARADRSDDGMVSASARIHRLKEIGRQVADTDAPVLLLGQSGVGKEVMARFIHGQSRRRARPFLKVNCAALPEDLLESELFGYERGAFSGALQQKPGLFEMADGGSILLDEIGEMTVHLQAKLLHVLQDGCFTRLGGRQAVKVDARVMASTNVDLDEACAAGRFRDDLFFRLNVIRLEIPPLKDRPEDIPVLGAHFLRQYSARYHRSVHEIPRRLEEAFLAHDWPGNIRELENAVRRYVILGDVEASVAELGARGRANPVAAVSAVRPEEPARRPAPPAKEGLSLRKVAADAAEEAERKLLSHVLAETKWNRRKAAGELKISYKALLNKLKKWEQEASARPPLEVLRPPGAVMLEQRLPAAEGGELRAIVPRDVLIGPRRWPRQLAR